jgi:hypothetical protein
MEARTHNLIEQLSEQQAIRGLNDGAFARVLGVSRATWILTKNGDLPIGISLLRGVLKEFPGLKDEVLAALAAYERYSARQARAAFEAT